jgi:hypothetical protein
VLQQCSAPVFGRFPVWILVRTSGIWTDDVLLSFTKPCSSFSCASPRYRAMATPIYFLQPSVFLVAAFQCRMRSNSTASLQTAPCHPLLGFATDLPSQIPLLLFVD